MKFLAYALLTALVCLAILTEVARGAPEAYPNAEADPFFFGGLFGGHRHHHHHRGYGYGGYGREGGGFGWGR